MKTQGSENICSRCKKDYKCTAYTEDFKMTINLHGAAGIFSLKDIIKVAQIRNCPIKQFKEKVS